MSRVVPGASNGCGYCGSALDHLLQTRDVNRNVTAERFELMRCRVCGLVSLRDPPSDLGRYYTTDYHLHPETVSEIEAYVLAHQFKVDIIKQFKTSGALLEIGPSIGSFCVGAKRAGFDVSAVEMDGDCVTFLNTKVGVRAVQSMDPVSVLTQEERDYDAICLWHSLEHIPQPWSVIEAAAARLCPSGILVIACPNPEAWQARIMASAWPHWDSPRHLHAMSINWILQRGAALGLSPLLVTTVDAGSRHYSRDGWSMLARNQVRGRLARQVFGKLGKAVGKLLGPWDDRKRQGSCYTIVLGKTALSSPATVAQLS